MKFNSFFKRPKLPSLSLKILLGSKIRATSFWFLPVIINVLFKILWSYGLNSDWNKTCSEMIVNIFYWGIHDFLHNLNAKQGFTNRQKIWCAHAFFTRLDSCEDLGISTHPDSPSILFFCSFCNLYCFYCLFVSFLLPRKKKLFFQYFIDFFVAFFDLFFYNAGVVDFLKNILTTPCFF